MNNTKCDDKKNNKPHLREKEDGLGSHGFSYGHVVGDDVRLIWQNSHCEEIICGAIFWLKSIG